MAETPTELRNIREILRIERESVGDPSPIDRVTEFVSRLASSPAFIGIHVVWFTTWIVANSRSRAFDPFPFNLLTLAVSLEAIVLTGFVLRAQSRMTAQADKRADLDLQINLLAEQELTAILRVLCVVGEHAGIDVASCDPRVEQFRSQTDVHAIAEALATQRAAVTSSRKQQSAPHGASERPPERVASAQGDADDYSSRTTLTKEG
jgi:uncharacterized membrane protein